MAQDKYGGKEQLLADMKQPPSVGNVATMDPLVETLVGYPLPGRQGLPLVEDWDCLRVSSNALPVSQEALIAILQYRAFCISGCHIALSQSQGGVILRPWALCDTKDTVLGLLKPARASAQKYV